MWRRLMLCTGHAINFAAGLMLPQSGCIIRPMKNRRHFLISATKVFAVGLGASLMLGCATPDPIAGPAVQVGFAHLPSMTFNVTRVDVGSTYNSPMQAPNAEHRMPAPPQRALFDWARTRLKASVTSQAVATFVVEDAAVIETKLQKTPGLKALFTYEAAERYDARVVASLSLNDPVSGASGSVQVRSDRSIEVRENATLAEREQAWVELVENIMADFNAQMDIQISTHLSAWLVR